MSTSDEDDKNPQIFHQAILPGQDEVVFGVWNWIFIELWYRKGLFIFSALPTYITWTKNNKLFPGTVQSLSITITKSIEHHWFPALSLKYESIFSYSNSLSMGMKPWQFFDKKN